MAILATIKAMDALLPCDAFGAAIHPNMCRSRRIIQPRNLAPIKLDPPPTAGKRVAKRERENLVPSAPVASGTPRM